jgi:hypothetical protein
VHGGDFELSGCREQVPCAHFSVVECPARCHVDASAGSGSDPAGSSSETCAEPLCNVPEFGPPTSYLLHGTVGQCRSLVSLLENHPDATAGDAIAEDFSCHARFGPDGTGLEWQAGPITAQSNGQANDHGGYYGPEWAGWDQSYDTVHLQGDCQSTDALAAGCTFVPCAAAPLACETHSASDCPLDRCAVGIEAYHRADGTTGRCLCDHRVDGLCNVDSNDVANLVSHRLATPDELVDPEFCRHQHGPNDELRWLRHDGDDELHDDHPFARLADDYYSLNYWGYSTSHLANIDRTSCNDPSNVDGARDRLRHDEHPSWCSPDDPWCMDYYQDQHNPWIPIRSGCGFKQCAMQGGVEDDMPPTQMPAGHCDFVKLMDTFDALLHIPLSPGVSEGNPTMSDYLAQRRAISADPDYSACMEMAQRLSATEVAPQCNGAGR